MTYNATYSTSDMNEIVIDNLATGGVELKTYAPLFVLGFILLLGVGFIVKIRRAGRV